MIKNGLLLFVPHEYVANLWILFSFYLYFLDSCVLFSSHSNLAFVSLLLTEMILSRWLTTAILLTLDLCLHPIKLSSFCYNWPFLHLLVTFGTLFMSTQKKRGE